MNAVLYLDLSGLVQLPDKVLMYQSMAVLTVKLAKANLKSLELPKAFSLPLFHRSHFLMWIGENRSRGPKKSRLFHEEYCTLLACP